MTPDDAQSSLAGAARRLAAARLPDLFAADPARVARFTLEWGGWRIDCSKERIDHAALDALLAHAAGANLAHWIGALFAGEKINLSEQRPVLHPLLRRADAFSLDIDGHDIGAEIRTTRERVAALAAAIRSGQRAGATGRPLRAVVNLGIGGSDLGPRLVCDALASPQERDPAAVSVQLVSNVDPEHLTRTLATLDPASTLFIVTSKTFTTQETLANAESARAWLAAALPAGDLGAHFVAVSTNRAAARAFGVRDEDILPMPEGVGGRYSLWSAVGLSIMIAVGPQQFGELLAGANEMDEHFRTAPLDKNLPVLLGMIGIWYRNFFGSQSYLVAPYSEALHYLPSYLQQLEMESNGKSARLDGTFVDYPTSAVTWGEPGTNGQHAFFQMLHQGPTIVPIDFIAVLTPEHPLASHHPKLLANCFAQSEALMLGRTLDEARKVAGPGKEALAPHLTFPGNRPTTTLLVDALTPRTLGALIALYEHKVLVQATVWDINPFDQWGVELGKILGKVVEADLSAESVDPAKHDSSTTALIERARAALKR